MNLMAELDIDRACDEFLRARGYGLPQPVVELLDAEADDDVPAEIEFFARAFGG